MLSSGQWEKCWIEEEVPIEEDSRKVLYELKKQVENFHYESNKAAEKQTGTTVKVINEGGGPYEESLFQDAFNSMGIPKPKPTSVDDINSCKEIKVLESYKFIIKGKPELEKAYNDRLKELT